MSICRFGILGAGSIAAHFCKAIPLVEGAELVAVASKSRERAEAFARENGVPQAYGSYEEMLREADINIVYIATTHNFHRENILLCLNAGKHVLCEKSMVTCAADAREVFRLAKEKNLFCMEAMWSRFLPQYRKAKQWIEEGRIGAIQSADVVIGFRAEVEPTHRLVSPELGGGAMYDIGVYAIEPLTWLIGEPVQEVLGAWRPHETAGTDARAAMILRFPSCDATAQCLFTANAGQYVHIFGSEGAIKLPFVNGGFEARLYNRDQSLAEEFLEPWEHGFRFELEEVVRCIAAGEIISPIMPPEATIECAQIYDRVLRG